MDSNISAEILALHKQFLEEFIDPDSGFLDELLRYRTFSEKDIRNIKDERPYHNSNAKLLDYIVKQSKYEFFAASLRNTKQGHIVNYLVADGKYRSEFGLEWPLTEHQLEILRMNQGTLVDLIEMRDLLGRLFSKEVISSRQKDDIYSKKKSYRKNEVFLEILRRRSQTDYKNTIECLHSSNQSHVAQILENGGVTVRIHVETDQTTEEEREIAEELAMRLGNKSDEERVRIWELTQLNIIATKSGQSVVLYVLCQTVKDVQMLQMSLSSGQLKDLTQQLFDQYLHRSKKTKVVGISVTNEELAAMKLFVEGTLSFINEKKENRVMSKTTIDQIPPELQDIILRKCCFQCAFIKKQATRLPGHKSISKLASASFVWFQRLTRRKFKVFIRRKLFGGDIHAAIINGLQPLHLSAGAGHKEIVNLLLNHGEKIHATDHYGFQPFHLAAANGHTEVVALLQDRGGDINARDQCGCQPLHLAAENGRKEVITLLLDRGGCAHARNNNGQQPLHIAALNAASLHCYCNEAAICTKQTTLDVSRFTLLQ